MSDVPILINDLAPRGDLLAISDPVPNGGNVIVMHPLIRMEMETPAGWGRFDKAWEWHLERALRRFDAIDWSLAWEKKR